MNFEIGDRVRVDIPDSDDPDHRFHGETGEVVEITQDDLGELFDDPRLNYLIKVKFDDEDLGTMTFRVHDLVERRSTILTSHRNEVTRALQDLIIQNNDSKSILSDIHYCKMVRFGFSNFRIVCCGSKVGEY